MPAPKSSDAAQPRHKEPLKPSAALRLVETYLEEVPQIVPPEPPRPIVQTRTIELDRFVRLKKIDAAYYHAPYFVVPRDAVGQEAFAVIRKTMAEKKLVGLGRVVLASREWLVEPLGNGLRGRAYPRDQDGGLQSSFP